MSVLDQINSHYGLFVRGVAQAAEQEVVVYFAEARVDHDQTTEMGFNEGTEHEVKLTGLNPIVSDDLCQKYRARFNRVLVYEVIEESCVAWDDSEVFTGKLFRTFSKSRFLDHIDAHLNVGWYKDVPEMSFSHYEICGLDSIVDVAAHEPPIIEEVKDFTFQ